MPLNIQGSGLHLDRNVALVNNSGALLVYNSETSPLDQSQNNPANKFLYVISGTTTGVTGSEIGSIVQFIGAGSFVQVFTWSNDLITNIGSWF